ncbi:MAG: hypothetical protein ACI9U2_004036, partial [Bradymonadia bacterium]
MGEDGITVGVLAKMQVFNGAVMYRCLPVLVLLLACETNNPSPRAPTILSGDAAGDASAPDDAQTVADAQVDGALEDAALRDAATRPFDAGPELDAQISPDAATEVDATIVDAGPPPPHPIVSEFVARNGNGLRDEDGEASDWFELYNPHATPYDLTDHCLSDTLDDVCRWRLPAREIEPQGFLVVFASGKDRAPIDGPLHTDFRLSGDGEALVFADADGRVLDVIADWPALTDDVAYGVPMQVERASILTAGAQARFTTDAPAGWQAPDYDDSAWQQIALPLGFDRRRPVDPRNPGPPLADSEVDFSGVQGLGGWSHGYYNLTADPDGTYAADDFRPFPADFFTGVEWDWPAGNPPWTLLGAIDVHPSGDNNDLEHWVIRRFTLPFDGEVVVDWTVRKVDPNGGGVTGKLIYSGALLDEAALRGGDVEGVTRRQVIAAGVAGAAVDLAVTPVGRGGETHDFSDGSASRLRIWMRAPVVVQGDVADVLLPGQAMAVRVPVVVPEGATRIVARVAVDDGVETWIDAEPWFDSGPLVDRPVGGAPIEAARAGITPGVHTLAFSLRDIDDGVLLLAPEVQAEQISLGDGYRHLRPTPGAPNQPTDGPIVLHLDRDHDVGPADPLTIHAQVIDAASVTLHWQVMFGPLEEAQMVRDAARAGELTWQAELGAGAAEAGQMVRWYIEAIDAEGRIARHPPFDDPIDSEAFYGTMMRDDRVQSDLPVLHWFIEQPNQATRPEGGRGALFFNGSLYDNVHADLHGQSSRGFPKKSYNVDLTKDNRFDLGADQPTLKDFNLLTNYADKSKLRNTLAYDIYRDAGVDYHFAFPVRVQQNGAYFAVYDFVEDGDDRWLERLGYPQPVGPLYKMYDRLEDARRGEKKTRKAEDSSDLAALIAGLRLDGEQRRRFLYDNVDMARMANYAAGMFIMAGMDCCHKNYYVYQDPRTAEWWMLPWDVDLSLGRNWTGNYFDDRMYPENPLFHTINNRLLEGLYALPEFREMYLRRVRSLADQIMQPPGTPNPSLEALADAWRSQIGADAIADNAVWPTWGERQTTDEGVRILKDEFLAPRRAFIYNTLAGPDGPLPAAQDDAVVDVVVEGVAVAAEPSEAYLILHNRGDDAVDLSDWVVSGR